MPELRLDNFDVRISPTLQISYGFAPCNFLLPITPDDIEPVLAEFKSHGEVGNPYSGLTVSNVSDLSFLRDVPTLTYLQVTGPKDFDAGQLEGLSNLRGLHVRSPGSGIDFSCFPYLELFAGDWHADNCNLQMAKELRHLDIDHFKPWSRDLADLSKITRLERLTIAMTNINSIGGLETLEDLRYLKIRHAPQLRSLRACAGENVDLREIEISNAKKIESHEPIASIQKLRRLLLSDCAEMENLKWIKSMSRLDFFSFVDTNIKDGDLAPILDLPAIQYVGTLDKRHYNFKCDELCDQIKKRHKL